jgi:hypothetical protein
MTQFFNSMEILRVVFLIVGIGGLGGLALIAILYPVIAQGIIAAIGAVLHEMLSTRMGCAVLAAIIAGTGASYMRGHIDNQEFAERIAQFELRQKARDKKIADDTRAAVTAELAELNKSVAVTDTDVKDFTDAAPIDPPVTPSIPASDPLRVGNDACRLRRIAGLPECGSERLGGVSQAAKRAARTFHHVRHKLPDVIRTGIGAAQ